MRTNMRVEYIKSLSLFFHFAYSSVRKIWHNKSMACSKDLDDELRSRLLALGIPAHGHSREALLDLLPPATRAAALSLGHDVLCEVAATLLEDGSALAPGRASVRLEDGLGRGTHACFFYRAVDELVAMASRSIAGAMRRNEAVLWATPQWLPPPQARRRLIESEPGMASFLESGRIEVARARKCYLDDRGRLLGREPLLASFHFREKEARRRGLDGLFVIADTSELSQLEDLDAYIEYEYAVTARLKGTQRTGLCTYSLLGCGTSIFGRLLYPHACALLAVGRSWQAIVDPDHGRDQLRAVVMSFIT